MSLNINNLDSENKQKLENGIIVSKKTLIGYAIYEAIVCRSYPKIPINIDYLIRDLNLICDKFFEKITDDYCCKTFKNIEEIEYFINQEIMCLNSFKELNLSTYEFNVGVNIDNSDRKSCKDKILDDFIDLGAYSRNLAHDLFIDYLDIDYTSFKNFKGD